MEYLVCEYNIVMLPKSVYYKFTTAEISKNRRKSNYKDLYWSKLKK